VGPAADPAGVHGTTDVTAASAASPTRRPSSSRADNSGTDQMEKELTGRCQRVTVGPGLVPLGRAGNGRGADDGRRTAGLHADRPGHIRRVSAKGGLRIEVAGDPRMFNPYSVISVNPAKVPRHQLSRRHRVLRLDHLARGTAGDRGVPDRRRATVLSRRAGPLRWTGCRPPAGVCAVVQRRRGPCGRSSFVSLKVSLLAMLIAAPASDRNRLSAGHRLVFASQTADPIKPGPARLSHGGGRADSLSAAVEAGYFRVAAPCCSRARR